MDVKLYGINAASRDYSRYRTVPSAPDPVKRHAAESMGSYDRLMLGGKVQYPTDTKQFARMLAKEAAGDIRTSSDTAKVDMLKSQVASGNYKPDASQIAQHMLCCF